MLFLSKLTPRAQEFRTWKCLFCPSRNTYIMRHQIFAHQYHLLTSPEHLNAILTVCTIKKVRKIIGINPRGHFLGLEFRGKNIFF